MAMLTERYADRLAGVLSCYDRIIITGTLPGVGYAQGMTSFPNAKGIRIFDYPQFAAPLRDQVRECAQALATKHGVPIQHINKPNIKKCDRRAESALIWPVWTCVFFVDHLLLNIVYDGYSSICA